MPTISLSDNTIQKLQMLAIPLEDNHNSVVERLADAALAGTLYALPGNSNNSVILGLPAAALNHAKPVPPVSAPLPTHDSLTHTRLTYASFDGEVVKNPKWNNLARLAHERAYQVLGSFEALQRATTAHIQQGNIKDLGYTYLSTADASLQGMDANQSWNSVAELAKRIGVPVETNFQWRNKPDAAHPGQDGNLCYKP